MMNKKYLLVPFLALGLLVSSCANSSLPNIIDKDDTGIDTPWEDYDIPVESLTFSSEAKNLEINVGESYEYTFEYAPKNATPEHLSWVVADESIALLSVNAAGNHIIKGVAPGNTTVTVSGGERAKFSPIVLNVRVDLPISSFTVTSSKSFTLDYNSSSQIEVEFSPAETTQKDLRFSSSDETVATVGETGLIHTFEKVGHATITVSSPYIAHTVTIDVTVADQYKYLSKFDLLCNKTSLEVDKMAELGLDIAPAEHDADMSEALFLTSTPEILSVEGNFVTALKEGVGKVYATVPERGGLKVSEEVTINVYEVHATEISLGADSKGSLALDNRDNSSHQLSYSFTTDELGEDTPSRSSVKYSCDPEGVVLVSEEGLITVFDGGSTRVTVTDEYSGLSDYVDVNVTLRSKSVTISGDSLAYLDETITLTANIVPADVDDNSISWSVTEGEEKLVLEKVDNKVTISATEEGIYHIVASNDGVSSEEFEIKFQERPVYFEDGNGYIVGSSAYNGGVSSNVEDGSWDKAKYAFKMHDRYDLYNDNHEVVGFGYKSVVTFREGDEWKIRMNSVDWRDIDSDGSKSMPGLYKITEGAFAKEQMSVKEDEGNRSVYVNVAGTYNISYAEFFDTEAGWYDVYVEEHGLKVDASLVNVQVEHTAELKASDWDGTLEVNMGDESIATVEKDKDGNITVTGVKAGETTLTIKDDNKQFVLPVTVSEKPVEFLDGHYYLVGNKDFSAGYSQEGESWNNPLQAFEFIEPVEDESLKEQYKGLLYLNSGEEFKIRRGNSYPEVYAEQKEAIPEKIKRDAEDYYTNFRVMETGIYEIYVKVGFDDGMSLYVKKVPELKISKEEITVQAGLSDTLTATNIRGELEVMSLDESIATVTKGENGLVLITGVSEGETSIAIADDLFIRFCKVTVKNEEVKKDITIYFAGVDGWGTISTVHFALDNNWVNAELTSGMDADYGQYKYVFETTEEASALNCYFTMNYNKEYAHPTSGNIDWDTNQSSINLGELKLEPGNSYVITWTDWHYSYDNFEHMWFKYTFTKIS